MWHVNNSWNCFIFFNMSLLRAEFYLWSAHCEFTVLLWTNWLARSWVFLKKIALLPDLLLSPHLFLNIKHSVCNQLPLSLNIRQMKIFAGYYQTRQNCTYSQKRYRISTKRIVLTKPLQKTFWWDFVINQGFRLSKRFSVTLKSSRHTNRYLIIDHMRLKS